MIHSIDGDGKKEFLIPVRKNDGFELVGTVSGQTYERAMIVFTGKEITPSSLAEKAEALGMKRENELYEILIEQIPNFRISKRVVLDDKSKQLVLEYAQ